MLFKFEYIYPNPTEKEVDSKGYQIERRYDKDGNAESEYIKAPSGYIKTKSKDKEVRLPYVWGKDPKPLDNIDKIRSYLAETPTRFEWYHKKDNPEEKYFIFLLSTLTFKQNK